MHFDNCNHTFYCILNIIRWFFYCIYTSIIIQSIFYCNILALICWVFLYSFYENILNEFYFNIILSVLLFLFVFHSYVGNYIFNGWYFSCVISVSLFFYVTFCSRWGLYYCLAISVCFRDLWVLLLCILAYYDLMNVYGHCALTRFLLFNVYISQSWKDDKHFCIFNSDFIIKHIFVMISIAWLSFSEN